MMKKILLAVLIATVACAAKAQNGINSPYSRYGFGLLSERAIGFNKGMGGVAQGFRDGQQINIANPASYSEVDSLTALFDLGVTLQNGNYKMDGLQQNVRNTSFDYFAMQFRAAKNVGMTFGILPISNTKYSFASQKETINGNENVTSSYSFNGDGGLREVFFGIGWHPFKPVSIGVNGSYVWGDYKHGMSMDFSESTAFGMQRIYTADISTYSVQAGLQYIQPISKKDKVVIGATYTLGHDVASRAYRTTDMTLGTTIESETVDTIKNAFQMPHSIAAGITYYHSNTLHVGADFELQKWGDCKFPIQNSTSSTDAYRSVKGQLNDRTKISAGLDWTPNPMERSILKRISYKVGGYYSKSYANADPTGTISDKPYEFGVSAGLSIPLRNKTLIFQQNASKLNLSFQWVHTDIPYFSSATMRQSSLKENYLKVCLGLTISEHWFYKWKF